MMLDRVPECALRCWSNLRGGGASAKTGLISVAAPGEPASLGAARSTTSARAWMPSSADLFGTEAAEAALALGVPPGRITTIAAGPNPPGGVRATRGGADATPADLERITSAILAGDISTSAAATSVMTCLRRLSTGVALRDHRGHAPAGWRWLRSVADIRGRLSRGWTDSWTEPPVRTVHLAVPVARPRGIRAGSAS